VFGKYWDHLPNLHEHPGFDSESSLWQDQMKRFSSALSTMNLSEFMPSVAAEADQTSIESAKEAAIFKWRPMQDGLDFCGDRSSPATESGPP
jgi:hypothetical protein